jgi:Holliday junction resolvase RusA-like endonuclease
VSTVTLDRVVSLRVVGVPTTQGSKNGFVVKSKFGKARAIVVDVKPHALRSWREAIRCDVVSALGAGWAPVEGPIRVDLVFALPKPASAPKRKRTWPIGARSGDIDKLERAVLDALTDSGIFKDDGQVVELRGVKDYVDEVTATPGVRIDVFRYSGA